MYEAVDLDLEIAVALKVLRPEYAGLPAAEARFRREATTAARLRHPNIVFIRDVGEAEGTVFVAMDLLPLSLARRLEVFPRLPETEVVRFALEVAAALSIAHADGVVHRDIKPDNVMLGGNGEAIVADFGLAGAFAKDLDKSGLAADDPGKVMGTPHYFSPEQARGLDLDGRTDLYSLGVMCYRAATGVLPFEGEDWYTVARQHVEDSPVPPRMLVPELTEGFDTIVLRLLAKNPEQRFASATQLADALLTLPTAPASRSVGITPSSASVTQVAFPYLHQAVGKRSWKRNATIGALAIAVTTVVALFASPTLGGRRSNSLLFNPEVIPTTPVKLDSTPPTADTGKPPAVVAQVSPAVTTPPVKPASPSRPPAPTRANVTVTLPDSARLWVDESPQKIVNGTWEGYLSIGTKHHFLARHKAATPGCKSAQIDTSLTFNTAQANVPLDVAPCLVLLLSTKYADKATLTVTSLEFSSEPRNFDYTGTPLPIVLRLGEYELIVRADKCSDFRIAKLIISRDSSFGADTIKKTAPLNCPPPLPAR